MITSASPDPRTGLVFSASGIPCFYCEEVLSDPAVHWHGATGDIYLHPNCLFPFFVRLGRDVHELQRPGYYQRLRSGQ